jgi:hypothetical protein
VLSDVLDEPDYLVRLEMAEDELKKRLPKADSTILGFEASY